MKNKALIVIIAFLALGASYLAGTANPTFAFTNRLNLLEQENEELSHACGQALKEEVK
jgi:hypothetical protein